jgi:hypothetical protein
MDYPDNLPTAWRDLAERFFALTSSGLQQVYAVWHPGGYAAGDTWSLEGFVSLDDLTGGHHRELFEWTAERGAVFLGHGGGPGSLSCWLDALRKESPRFVTQQTGHALDDGSVEMEESGFIHNVCAASGEYCYRLETMAMAKKHEMPVSPPIKLADRLSRLSHGAEGSKDRNKRAARPEVRFPNRAIWLQQRLTERAWDHNDPPRHNGPDRKTIDKILRGEGVREDVLEKLTRALSRKVGKVDLLDIPRS